MIANTLDKLQEYSSKYSFIDDIVSFLKNTTLDSLPYGRTIINDRIYLNKETYYGKKSKETPFEFHQRHIDIQIVIDGQEIIETTNQPLTIDNYDYDLDIGFVKENDKKINKFFMEKGFFLLLETNEWHKPCIKVNNSKIIKIVFKIKSI